MSDPYAETDEWPTPVLPAQISTERDFPCCEVRRDDKGATNAATWRDRGRIIADLTRRIADLEAELAATRTKARS